MASNPDNQDTTSTLQEILLEEDSEINELDITIPENDEQDIDKISSQNDDSSIENVENITSHDEKDVESGNAFETTNSRQSSAKPRGRKSIISLPDMNHSDMTSVTTEDMHKLMELRGTEAVLHLQSKFGSAEMLCHRLGSHPTKGMDITGITFVF